jgi:hypothetical protein
VFIARDHTIRVLPIPDPPPPRFEVPVPRPWCGLEEPDDRTKTPPRLVFQRAPFLSSDHAWWRVYNEGRSRTPERAPVYFEAPRPSNGV